MNNLSVAKGGLHGFDFLILRVQLNPNDSFKTWFLIKDTEQVSDLTVYMH
jgi:hypothetical protein